MSDKRKHNNVNEKLIQKGNESSDYYSTLTFDNEDANSIAKMRND